MCGRFKTCLRAIHMTQGTGGSRTLVFIDPVPDLLQILAALTNPLVIHLT
jgi:hypothetical protein